MQGIIGELNRRNVFRVGIAYLVASWVVLQIIDVIVPILELPEWTAKLVFVILAVGLVPALIFAWAFEMTPEGIKREEDVDRSESITGKTAHKLNYMIIGSLVVAVAILLIDRQMDDTGAAGDADVVADAGSDAAETAAAESREASVAVLPFVNMSDDKDYFADGITEEILNALASVKELKVAGRTSSFAFKNQNDDLRRIGDALGVAHILEGSVRRSGDTVRITAQLIHVEDGFHLWSETYDRKLDDVFQVQDEISREILKQLSSTLLSDTAVPAVARRTNPMAYELYLRAKQRIYTREGAAIELAVEELKQAIEIDPEYAPAYAQLGVAAILLSEEQYGDTPYDEAHRRGKRFLDLALKLDSNLAEGLAALGLYEARIGGDVDASIDALTKALDINPNHIDARNWLQISLGVAGEHRAALDIVMEIAETDPLYMPAFSNGIAGLISFGETERADQWVERLEKFDPDNPRILLARAVGHNRNGRVVEALRALEQARTHTKLTGIWIAVYTNVLTNTGQYERAIEEGHTFWRPFLLHRLDQKEEAYALAREQALAGVPGNLIELYARDGRYKDLTDFLEERWPSLDIYTAENPGGVWGYDDMMYIALAYEQQGEQQRFDNALQILSEWEQNLLEQGVNNRPFTLARADLSALKGENDQAFEYLEAAVDAGWLDSEGVVNSSPIWKRYAGDSRLVDLENRVLTKVNEARAALELPLFDESYQPIEPDNSEI